MEVFIVNSILNHAYFLFLCYGGWIVAGCWSFSSIHLRMSTNDGAKRKREGWIEGVRRCTVLIQYRKICNYKHCLNKKKGSERAKRIMKLKRMCHCSVSVVESLHVIHSIGCHLKTLHLQISSHSLGAPEFNLFWHRNSFYLSREDT